MAHDAGSRAMADQATLPVFRALVAVQALAAGFFGLFPYLLPQPFAAVFGFEGAELFIYQLLGAASLGYAIAALGALRWPSWRRQRIPAIATLVFNVAAILAALIALAGGERQFLVLFILAAASAFSLITAYWLYRDQAPEITGGRPIEPWFRALLAVATAAAAFFGLAPLLVPEQFASLSGFAVTDLFVYRLAGAATLGYAVAGLFQIRARTSGEIRLQVAAALVFNAFSAVAALGYVAGGGRSMIGLLILLAATAFSLAFAWWLRGERRHGG